MNLSFKSCDAAKTIERKNSRRTYLAAICVQASSCTVARGTETCNSTRVDFHTSIIEVRTGALIARRRSEQD